MSLGFDIEKEKLESSDEDWIFGADSKFCLALIPEALRDTYFPLGEVQYGKEDFMDCASRAPLNILETKFNYLVKNNLLSTANYNWLQENGYINHSGVTFSDRFVAINSGTTKNGNSLKAPLEAIRKQGLIPKAMLPANPNMTWAEYHAPEAINDDMRALGEEFARRFAIRYEKVYETNFGVLLGEDMLDTAGFAWPPPVDGVYPKSNNTPNHAFMTFRNAFYAYDNYRDVDLDFVKHLARDYDFMDYGYRVYIESEEVPKKNESWLSKLIKYILSLFS